MNIWRSPLIICFVASISTFGILQTFILLFGILIIYFQERLLRYILFKMIFIYQNTPNTVIKIIIFVIYIYIYIYKQYFNKIEQKIHVLEYTLCFEPFTRLANS